MAVRFLEAFRGAAAGSLAALALLAGCGAAAAPGAPPASPTSSPSASPSPSPAPISVDLLPAAQGSVCRDGAAFPDRTREVRGAVGWVADLLPKPGGNPCPGGPAAKNVTCRRTGSERIGGRVADRWEVVFEAGGRKLVVRRWVDRELGVWLRYVTYEGATFEVVGIRVGSQPASLFQVPRDYKPAGR